MTTPSPSATLNTQNVGMAASSGTQPNTNTITNSVVAMPVISPIVKLQTAKGEPSSKQTTPHKVLTIESKEHFTKILKEAGEKYIMVEFYAQWCGPCKTLGVKLEELAELYRDKLVIAKIDVDDLEELAIEYDVTNMPGFMIMKNKEKLEQFSGSKVEQLETALEKYLGKMNNE